MTTLLDRPNHAIKLGSRRVRYSTRFSRTATRARIKVRPEGVQVVLPADADEGRARSFLRDNSDWVIDQLAFIERMGALRTKTKRSRRAILFRGNDTPVEIIEEDCERRFGLVDAANSELRIRVPRDRQVNPWRTLENWLRRQARHEILKRIKARRSQMPRTRFGKIYVMGQRTKWGGCSRRKNLSFNWRLIMAPPAVLDYIVVHELAHLVEPYHSTKFWLIVRSYCPRFEEHRAWLRNNEDRLKLPRS